MILREIEVGTYLEVPYIIDNDGDGEVRCEVIEHGDTFTEVRRLDTQEFVLVDGESMIMD